MQDDPCTFHWQEKLANGRTAIGAASGLSDASALGQVSARAAAIRRLSCKTPPLNARAAAVLAVAQIPACNDRSEERSSTGRDGLHAVDCGHQRLLTSCQLFSKCAAPSAAARNPPTSTTEAVRGANDRIAQAGPSSSIAEAVSRCGQSASNAATGRAAAIDEDNPAGNEFPETASARLWNPPYTPWRADRPAICGGNATVR